MHQTVATGCPLVGCLRRLMGHRRLHWTRHKAVQHWFQRTRRCHRVCRTPVNPNRPWRPLSFPVCKGQLIRGTERSKAPLKLPTLALWQPAALCPCKQIPPANSSCLLIKTSRILTTCWYVPQSPAKALNPMASAPTAPPLQ
jgi:hypothetical protein